MKNQMSTENFALFLCPLARAEYFGRDYYHLKLAKMMSSSSFSTHAECIRHRTYADSSACFTITMGIWVLCSTLSAQVEPCRKASASYHTLAG